MTWPFQQVQNKKILDSSPWLFISPIPHAQSSYYSCHITPKYIPNLVASSHFHFSSPFKFTFTPCLYNNGSNFIGSLLLLQLPLSKSDLNFFFLKSSYYPASIVNETQLYLRLNFLSITPKSVYNLRFSWTQFLSPFSSFTSFWSQSQSAF